MATMRLPVRCAAGTGQPAGQEAPTPQPVVARPQRVTPMQLITGRRQLLNTAAVAACLCCPPLPAWADGEAAAVAPAAAPAAAPPAPAPAAAAPPAATPALAAPPPPQPWGYSCLTGPNTWGGTCATQGFQSPIAINYDERFPPAGDPALDILYPRFPRYIKDGVTVKNTGHGTMQVSMPEGVDYYLRGQRHRLLQFHFHTPSEHTLDGRHLAMEAHLVHKNLETGNLAVLGVFIEAGEGWMPHPVIAEAMRSAPRAAGVETPLQRAISLRTLLPNAREADGRRPYVNYSGSLTTPPCSTGVDWYVFLDPLHVDAEQIVDFMYYAGSGARPGVNARPPQPIGDRQLKYFAA